MSRFYRDYRGNPLLELKGQAHWPTVTNIENGTVKTVWVEKVEVEGLLLSGFITLSFQIETEVAIGRMTLCKLSDDARDPLDKVGDGGHSYSDSGEVYLKVSQKRGSERTELCNESDSDVKMLDDSPKLEGRTQ